MRPAARFLLRLVRPVRRSRSRRVVITVVGVLGLVGALVAARAAMRSRGDGRRAGPPADADAVASVGVTDAADDDVMPADLHDGASDDGSPSDGATVAARAYAATAPHVEPAAEPTEPPATDEAPAPADEPLDLGHIERDLEGVEAALRRLDDGTYWTDEITGEPLDEQLLLADPVARRNR